MEPRAPIKTSIQGFVYEITPISAGECGTIAFSMLKTATNNRYDIIRNFFDEVTCDCTSYEFNKSNTDQMCKHGQKLVELGLVAAPVQVQPEPLFDGKALYSWALGRGIVGMVSAVARQMGHNGYLRMNGPKAANEIYGRVAEMDAEVESY